MSSSSVSLSCPGSLSSDMEYNDDSIQTQSVPITSSVMGGAASRQSPTFLSPQVQTNISYAFGPTNTSQARGLQAYASTEHPHIHSGHQMPVDPTLWEPDINPGHGGSSSYAPSNDSHHATLRCTGQASTRQNRAQHGGVPGPFLEWRLYNEQYLEQLKASHNTPTRGIMGTNNHTNQAVLTQGNSSLNENEAYSYPQIPTAQNALPAGFSQPTPFTSNMAQAHPYPQTQVSQQALPAGFLPLPLFTGNTAQPPGMDSSSTQVTSQPSFSPVGTANASGHQTGVQRAPSHRSITRWTDAEVQQAQSMQAQGMRTEDIAGVLGKSESAVTAKLWRKSGKDPHAAKKQRRA